MVHSTKHCSPRCYTDNFCRTCPLLSDGAATASTCRYTHCVNGFSEIVLLPTAADRARSRSAKSRCRRVRTQRQVAQVCASPSFTLLPVGRLIRATYDGSNDSPAHEHRKKMKENACHSAAACRCPKMRGARRAGAAFAPSSVEVGDVP